LDGNIEKADDKIDKVVVNSRKDNNEIVQVRFSWVIDGITYNDALNIPKSDYEKMTEEQIEKMKQERVEKWVSTVNKMSTQ
jgi:hypothetical protein